MMIPRFLLRIFKSRIFANRIELSEIKKYIKSDDIVCDIGANKAAYTYWLSKWASNGKVFAFEPQRAFADYLRQVVKVFKLHNVIVEEKALSCEPGEFDLFIPEENSNGSDASLKRAILNRKKCRTEKVAVTTLDDYFPGDQKVSIMKVDVEGAELDVFKGGEQMLRRDKPLLVFESEDRHMTSGSVNDVLEFLFDLGYKGGFVLGNSLVDIKEFDLEIYQRQEGRKFHKKKDYVNNFVFHC